MKVIGVRTDAPSYLQGMGAITIVADIRTGVEQGMYKLQAYIKKSGDPSTAWVAAGYEQWGTTNCNNCVTSATMTIPVPTGFGKYVVAVMNRNNIEDSPGASFDDMLVSQGAYTYVEIFGAKTLSYGLLVVKTAPAFAQVIIDGADTGRKTAVGVYEKFALPEGPHTLLLMMPGYMPYTQNVNIESQRTTEVSADLIPAGGQPFVNIGEGRPRPDVTWQAPTAYAAWGDRYDLNYKPVLATSDRYYAPSTPFYAPTAFAPVFRNAPTPFVAPNSPYQIDVVGGVTGALGGFYDTYIKPNLWWMILGTGVAVTLYMLSKPKFREKATEYAARGGVVTRAGLGGAKDVAKAAYRGFKGGRVEGLKPEEVEDIIQESRQRKEMAKRESARAKAREMEAKRARESAEAHAEEADTIIDMVRNGQRNGRRRPAPG